MKRGEFTALQDKWRAADEKLADDEIRLNTKYGRGWQPSWISIAERKRNELLRERTGKASDKVFAWLDKNSPWDWENGVSRQWTLSRLTEAMALSEDPPLLPAKSASYGYHEVDRPASRRRT